MDQTTFDQCLGGIFFDPLSIGEEKHLRVRHMGTSDLYYFDYFLVQQDLSTAGKSDF